MLDTANALPPLTKLPPREWRLAVVSDPDKVGISVYARVVDGRSVRHWQKWPILDFPNDFFGIEDLEDAGLLERYVAAIEQLQLGAAAQLLRSA